MERKRKRSYLPLQAEATSPFGQVIDYLQRLYTKPQMYVQSLLKTIFLPFIVPRTDPDYRAIALRGVHQCEALARMLREYAELPAVSSAPVINTAEEFNRKLDSPLLELGVTSSDAYRQSLTAQMPDQSLSLREQANSAEEPEKENLKDESSGTDLEQLNRQLGVNFDI